MVEVKALQHSLNLKGADPHLAEDGVMGPKTKAAVIAFQHAHSLPGTGVVDEATADKLGLQWEVVPVKPAHLESTCPAPGVYGAVDISEHAPQHFLDTMKYLGIKTIIRYFDYSPSSLPGKVPTAAELAMIKKSGFKFLGVFQHSNNKVETFEIPNRGARDAARALELAHQWGQPKGAAIYVGVDFDASAADLVHVKVYMKQFSDAVRTAGYRVGAYGSGLTLDTLLAAQLIDLCWLSMATGHRGSKEFADHGPWALHQVKNRTCGGLDCDFDFTRGDIGDWYLP